jgi:hypothetical protein
MNGAHRQWTAEGPTVALPSHLSRHAQFTGTPQTLPSDKLRIHSISESPDVHCSSLLSQQITNSHTELRRYFKVASIFLHKLKTSWRSFMSACTVYSHQILWFPVEFSMFPNPVHYSGMRYSFCWKLNHFSHKYVYIPPSWTLLRHKLVSSAQPHIVRYMYILFFCVFLWDVH